jgi:hypothetical protein
MALSVTFTQSPNTQPTVDQRTISYFGVVTIGGSGNYVTGGIPVLNTKAIVTAALGQNTPYADRVPLAAQLNSAGGSGYTYAYNPTTQKMQIFTGSAAQSPGTELSPGSLPAGVTSDVIDFELIFPRI